MSKNILVTGGAGYIGSHTCVTLIQGGFVPVIVDDLSNANIEVLNRIERITGTRPKFYQTDVCNEAELNKVFDENDIEAVINFAGFKAVGESVEKPLEYYTNNISGMLQILSLMRKHHVKKLIFSSSATVYGDPIEIPITENCPKGTCTNPYGWTKWMIEQIITDVAKADKDFKATLLRYFNPIGAHESALMGEDPKGIPNNLLPFIAQVAVGRREKLNVFGNDYDTIDGTGVRDYIHVCDLAVGHVKALQYMDKQEGVEIFNLGTGRGESVLQVVSAFERVSGVKIPYEIKPRRAGDIATCYCDPERAEKLLGFKAEKNIEDMCRDSWNWQRENPMGYIG